MIDRFLRLFEVRLALPMIVVIGLLARLIAYFVLPPQNFPDALHYVEAGRALLADGVMGDTHFMPVYPLLTALAGGTEAIKWVDIGISTLFIVLVHRFALILGCDRRGAGLAAAITALYPHFVFYSISGLTETTYMALLVAAYACLYRERMGAGSVLLVLSILERPTLDLFAPVLIVLFTIVVHRRSWRIVGLNLLKYFLVYVALMTPWWLHNHNQYGRFVRLNLGDGIVLYSGNNPLNMSGGGVAYGRADDDMDLSSFMTIADPIARNEAMKQAAMAHIRAEPELFLERMGIKLVRFWRLWPYAPEYQSPAIIIVSLASYGVVLPLALWGLIRGGRRHLLVLSPVLGLAAYLSLVHMITIGSIRYRLPIEPFLIILAASAVVTGREAGSREKDECVA